MNIFGSAELEADVRGKGLCVNCGACTGLCPYNISYKGRISQLFECDIKEGRCYAHCPKTEVDYDILSEKIFGRGYSGEEVGFYKDIFLSKKGASSKLKGKNQNGGTVSSLMYFMLEKGYIDAAAVTGSDGLVPAPELITDPLDIEKFSTTKYMASPTAALINESSKKGYKKIGFAGTPCQITASALMKLNSLDREDFLDRVYFSIGLFCTWALDTRKFIEILEPLIGSEKIIKTDVPPPPKQVLEVTTEKRKIMVPLEKIRKIIPDGCLICPDLTSEFSDVSVGVYENDPAWNVLIIRSEKGSEIVKEAAKKGYLEIEKPDDENLKMLFRASLNKKRRALKKADESGLLNTSDENIRAAIRISPEIVEKIMGQGGI